MWFLYRRCYANGTCNLFGSDKRNLSKNDDGTCTCNKAIGAFEAGGFCRWCDENYFFNRYLNSGCVACGGSYQTYSVHAQKCLGSGFYAYYHYNGPSNGDMISCSVEIVENENITYGAWNANLVADELSCKRCTNRCYQADDQSCRLANGSPYYRVSSTDEAVNGICTTEAPSE